jgi:hypothetical protein
VFFSSSSAIATDVETRRVGIKLTSAGEVRQDIFRTSALDSRAIATGSHMLDECGDSERLAFQGAPLSSPSDKFQQLLMCQRSKIKASCSEVRPERLRNESRGFG